MNRLTEALLDWYADNKRDLPWRGTTDPYRIWISEIILQQTRVVQGYEYFLRFIRRFPDVRTLASASEDEVLKYWQGLGYYSRARNLHAAAKSMNGKFPESYQEVRALKGVGDYTAAAICSIAYNMPYAVVDGNVYRVLSRYCGIDVPIDSTEGKKLFAALADEMLDKSRPAVYNQAILIIYMYAWARVPLYINERLMIFGKTCLNCHWLKRIEIYRKRNFYHRHPFAHL